MFSYESPYTYSAVFSFYHKVTALDDLTKDCEITGSGTFDPVIHLILHCKCLTIYLGNSNLKYCNRQWLICLAVQKKMHGFSEGGAKIYLHYTIHIDF